MEPASHDPTQPPPLPAGGDPPAILTSPTTGTVAASTLDEKVARDVGVGVIWLVVLAAIARSPEPIHGYEIARTLSQGAPEGFAVKHGTLYPILRTMETESLVSSTLVPSTEGPARKCFRITDLGRRTLAAWIESWKRTQAWVAGTIGEWP